MTALLWKFKGELIGAAIFAVIVFSAWWWHSGKVEAAYQRGVTTERIAWEETRRRAEAQRAEERRQAQSIIDAQAARIIAQEQAIEARDADAERDFEDARRTGDDPVVPDAWLRGVRKPRRRSGESGTRADRRKAESALRRASGHPGRRSTRLGSDAAVAEGQDEPCRLRSPSFGACRSSRGARRGAGEVAGEAGLDTGCTELCAGPRLLTEIGLRFLDLALGPPLRVHPRRSPAPHRYHTPAQPTTSIPTAG